MLDSTNNPYAAPAIAAEVRPRRSRFWPRVVFAAVVVAVVVVAATLSAVGKGVRDPWIQGAIGTVLILMNLPGLVIFLPLRFTLFQDIAQWHEGWKIASMLATFLMSGMVWGWLASICFEAVRRRRGVA